MKKGFMISILVCMAGVVGLSAYKLLDIHNSYKQARDVYADIEDLFEGENFDEIDDDIDVQKTKYSWKWIWKRLKEKYPDLIGYISQEGVISYPIVQAEDNDKYLRNMINGEYNIAGSIFADCAFPDNMNEHYSIIYGHNMNDTSMFGSLKLYANEDYYKEHPTFDIYIREKHYKYYVFSSFIADAYGDVYSYRYTGDVDAFMSHANFLRRNCPYKTDAPEITETDKIIILSTCVPNAQATNYSTRRIVCLVQGEEIEEVDIDN